MTEFVAPYKTVRMGDLSGSLFKKKSKSGKEYITVSIQIGFPDQEDPTKTKYRGFNIFVNQLDALKYIITKLEEELKQK
jgi:hypothetical protein